MLVERLPTLILQDTSTQLMIQESIAVHLGGQVECVDGRLSVLKKIDQQDTRKPLVLLSATCPIVRL